MGGEASASVVVRSSHRGIRYAPHSPGHDVGDQDLFTTLKVYTGGQNWDSAKPSTKLTRMDVIPRRFSGKRPTRAAARLEFRAA